MASLHQVVLPWDPEVDVVLTVQVRRRQGPLSGEEWRLAYEVASVIWATWHLSALEAASEQGTDRPEGGRDG